MSYTNEQIVEPFSAKESKRARDKDNAASPSSRYPGTPLLSLSILTAGPDALFPAR